MDAWRSLHDTFVREAKEAGTAGRPRCRTLFLGDSIAESMRGSQFGELYDELAARREAFEATFPLREARAFGVAGDRTQHLLWRVRNGELAFRHPPGVVVVCVGTNNLGRTTTRRRTRSWGSEPSCWRFCTGFRARAFC